MKISQLYSNRQFESIVFNDGLNLVLAGHSLTTLIDFMLLKQADNKPIVTNQLESFSGCTFYLELLLNTGDYLTIKRPVNNTGKISFKVTKHSGIFLKDKEWDHSDLPSTTAEKVLNNYLQFDALQSLDTTTPAYCFLRSQKDYDQVFMLSKFFRDEDWKPFMFKLLGFDGSLLVQKYQIEKEISEQKVLLNRLKSFFDPAETDRIKVAIAQKRSERAVLEKELNNFNFYEQEKILNRKLIVEVERRISELKSLEYNLEFSLEKTLRSLAKDYSFEIEQVKQIYEDAKIFFPDNLVKDYTALQTFNIKLNEERNKYHEVRIASLSAELTKIRQDIKRHNRRRSRILSLLKSKDSFRKFKNYQIDLAKLEGEISGLAENLKNINRINTLNGATHKLSCQSNTLVKKIKLELNSEDNVHYHEIRRAFRHILQSLINVPATIHIKQNTRGNIDFNIAISGEQEQVEKSTTYLKMSCIAFDLAVLAAWHNKPFYRFACHDQALLGLNDVEKMIYLNLVSGYCEKYNLQYILTSSEDDIPAGYSHAFTTIESGATPDDAAHNRS